MSEPPRKADSKEPDMIERQKREEALEAGLEDSMAGSDPIAAVQPSPSAADRRGPALQIKSHQTSDLVELSDGSSWRIWPGDVPKSLQWTSTTELAVCDIEDELCSHALVDLSSGERIRVIAADRNWPPAQLKQALKEG
jgi:hypothetical protein